MKNIPRLALERFISFLPFSTALIDKKLKVLLANQQFEEIMGLSSKMIVEKSCEELFSANKHILNIIERALQNNSVCSESKSTLYRWGRPPIPIEVTASPIGERGNIFQEASLILILKDNSTIAQIESREEQNELIKNMEVFSHRLIHEIRNPLGSIKGAAQMLKKVESLNEDSMEFLNIILSEVSRLNRMTGDLSTFMSNKSVPFERLNIHKIIDRVLNTFSLDNRFRNINFKREYDPSLPEIEGNEDELIQLFQNIIKNAAESQDFQGEIITRTKYTRIAFPKNSKTAHHGYLAIEIIDCGEGIPEERKDKIFLPFFTTKKEGTGLGLAISLKIATKHNGMIEFKNREDEKGSICRITLPFAKD